MSSKSPFSLLLLTLLLALAPATIFASHSTSDVIPPITETTLILSGTRTVVSTSLTGTSILEATGSPGGWSPMSFATAPGLPVGTGTLDVDETTTGTGTGTPTASPSASTNGGAGSQERRIGGVAMVVGVAGLVVGAVGV